MEHIRYYPELLQGSDEWLEARCGLVTASEMKLLLTPTLKVANNDKTRAHLYELAAQRISRYTEPTFVSDDMVRGLQDEVYAAEAYAAKFGEVSDMGFITNNRWGFTLGYSPDKLVGADGLLECKSRRQKYQIQTVIECAGPQEIPPEYMLQCQTALLVSERKWIDLASYSAGLPMVVIRAHPDEAVQSAILEAVEQAEETIGRIVQSYHDTLASGIRYVPTERRPELEMFV